MAAQQRQHQTSIPQQAESSGAAARRALELQATSATFDSDEYGCESVITATRDLHSLAGHQDVIRVSMSTHKRKAVQQNAGQKRKGKMRADQQQQQSTAMTERDFQRENAISIRLAETEAEIWASDARQEALSDSTKQMYSRLQGHYMEWLARKKYLPGSPMTEARFLRYVQELVAEEAVESDDGRHCIRPLRNDAGELAAPQTVLNYVKAVLSLHEEHRAIPGNGHLPTGKSFRSPAFQGIMKLYVKRHWESKMEKNVERLTIDVGYPIAVLKRLLKECWTRGYKRPNGGRTQKQLGSRDRLSFAWNHYLVSRGQSVREAKLPNLYPHTYATTEHGMQFAFGVVLEMMQGKPNQDHAVHSSLIRSKDVEICPLSCLAFYFLELWMVPDSAPNFAQDTWKSYYIIFASTMTKPMASSTMYRSQKNIMNKACHNSTKVTHAGRVAGSNHAYINGAGIEDIALHGNWNHRRLVTHYLSPVPKEVPYRLAGFTLQNEEFWLERNTLIPPVDLQRCVFPFIEDLYPRNADWTLWIENIMMDRPEEFNRVEASQINYPNNMFPAMRIMLILAHLRKVVLQDAVVLQGITGDPQCVYYDHHIFSDIPVFKSPLFHQFKMDLQQRMQQAVSPLTDSLTANAPAIHQEFRSVKTTLTSMESFIRTDFGGTFKTLVQKETADFTNIIGQQLNLLSRQLLDMTNTFQAFSKSAERTFKGASLSAAEYQSQQDALRRQHLELQQQALQQQQQQQQQLGQHDQD